MLRHCVNTVLKGVFGFLLLTSKDLAALETYSRNIQSVTYQEFKQQAHNMESQFFCDWNHSSLEQSMLLEASLYYAKISPVEEPLHLITEDFKKFSEENGLLVSDIDFENYRVLCIKESLAFVSNQSILTGRDGSHLGFIQVWKYNFKVDTSGNLKIAKPQNNIGSDLFVDIASLISSEIFKISDFKYKTSN